MPVREVPFGDARVALRFPDDARLADPKPPAPSGAHDPLGVVAEALDAPVAGEPLVERARGAGRVAIVVPDPSRPSGMRSYLLPLLARLAQARLGPRNLVLVVARGIHPAVPRAEVQELVGREILDALKVVQSAPESPELNASLGEDEELGDVRAHRLVADADLVVLTGAVVPHHLAGFGGGAKALVPGVAERDTVLAAHRLTLRTLLGPDGSVRPQTAVAGPNPFREALLRIAEQHGRCFLLNVVLDADGLPAAAASGPVREAHAEAVAMWQARHPADAPREPADLVVAGAGSTRGRDLIQAHKVLLEAAARARPGAPIVWLARAAHGPGHPAFLPWFEIRGLDRHLAALRRDFHPYGLTAYSIRRIAKDHPVHVASDVDADLLRPMGLLPAKSPQQALDRALKQAAGPSVALVGG